MADITNKTPLFVHGDTVHINDSAFKNLPTEEGYNLLMSLDRDLKKVFHPTFAGIPTLQGIIRTLKSGYDAKQPSAFHYAAHNVEPPKVLTTISDSIKEEVERHEKRMEALKADYDEQAIAFADALSKQLPPYQYPDGYLSASFDERLQLPARKTFSDLSLNSTVRWNGYLGRVSVIKRIWDAGKWFWSGLRRDAPSCCSSSIGGYYRDVVFVGDTVKVGCQTIHRHQFEKFAHEMGWDFPTPESYETFLETKKKKG